MNLSNLEFSYPYELPQGMQNYSKEGKSYLAGEKYFKVSEIEVYSIIWKHINYKEIEIIYNHYYHNII